MDTRLNMDENKIVMDITTVQSNKLHVVHSVKPGKCDSYFLKIPFPAVAKGVNKATYGLTVFDDPFFKFYDDADEYCPVYYPITNLYTNLKVLPYSLANIYTSTYTECKEDIEQKVYRMWFNDQMVNFYQWWLLRTNNQKHIKATKIIDALVTSEVITLFEFHSDHRTVTRNLERQRSALYHIHKYINLHLDLLSKTIVLFSGE